MAKTFKYYVNAVAEVNRLVALGFDAYWYKNPENPEEYIVVRVQKDKKNS